MDSDTSAVMLPEMKTDQGLQNTTLNKQMKTQKESASFQEKCEVRNFEGCQSSLLSEGTTSADNKLQGVSNKRNITKDENLSTTENVGSNVKNVKLKNIVESLIDFCVRVVRCCPDLCAVLTALNECHAHEVQLFFRAVRSREPILVGQLQEQLLDTGSHNRLVTILSDMYT